MTCRRASTRSARRSRTPRACTAPASRSPSASTTRSRTTCVKLRQAAGIAVAHGLPYEAALAALTRNPAEIFGVADRNGSLERGRIADLVLWSGDPLEVTSLAGRGVHRRACAQPMRSRQTELRDRYLPKTQGAQRALSRRTHMRSRTCAPGTRRLAVSLRRRLRRRRRGPVEGTDYRTISSRAAELERPRRSRSWSSSPTAARTARTSSRWSTSG